MKSVGLIVPVYKNFEGFAELMASVDMPVKPYIIDNWKENRGVSKGWNLGLVRAIEDHADIVFIVNDDVVLEPGTMSKMILGISEGYDLVTGINTRDGGYDGGLYNDEPDYSCFAVDPIRFVYRFGWFDENFSPAYFEDNDMSYRIRLAGGKDVKRTDAPFFHKGSVTQNWGGSQVVTHEMFERNREYYVWKWGGVPGEETRTTPNTLPIHEETGIGLDG